MKFGQFISYYNRKKKSNISTKLRPENYFQAFLCLERIKHNLYWKFKFLKQASYIRCVIAKLSKFIQISMQTFSNSFYRQFFEN